MSLNKLKSTLYLEHNLFVLLHFFLFVSKLFTGSLSGGRKKKHTHTSRNSYDLEVTQKEEIEKNMRS